MVIKYQTGHPLKQLSSWIKASLPILLLSLTLILFVSKSLYNIPISIMALMGAWQTIKKPSTLYADALARSFLMVFMCIWIPMVFALLDAVNFVHSAQTVLPYLRYLFAGIYLIQANRKKSLLVPILATVFFVLSFWSIDALIQYLFGKNLFGFPYESGHITGMFYPRNTIAHVLAALSPLYFEYIRRLSKREPWWFLLIIPLFVLILLSGRRAAWIMLIISSCGYFLCLYKLGIMSLNVKKYIFLAFVSTTLAMGLVIATNNSVQNRIVETTGIFSLDYETTDKATAGRLPIWETAISVFKQNWVNGIGPRGFRHVYKEYSKPGDFWHETGVTNPHQLILEVLAETGLIGFAGLSCFVFLLYKLFTIMPIRRETFPYVLAVFVVLFPINTSMAFYGSYWSSIIWWLIILAYLSIDDTNSPRKKTKAPP